MKKNNIRLYLIQVFVRMIPKYFELNNILENKIPNFRQCKSKYN